MCLYGFITIVERQKITNKPKGTLARQGAFMQIVSFCLLLFALSLHSCFEDNNLSGIFGIFVSLIVGVAVVQLLLRRTSNI